MDSDILELYLKIMSFIGFIIIIIALGIGIGIGLLF